MIFVSYAEKLKVIHGKEASVKDGFYLEKVLFVFKNVKKLVMG